MKAFLKLANGFVSVVTGFALLIAGAYAAYCLWDNQQVYAAAENVQAELLLLKPKAQAGEEDLGPTFGELIAINADVRAWVSMDGTKIDHPVLQGMTNMDYINMDVYGNFALAGSIFLDSRNAPDFSDPYSILYGHHMENSAMFGDLDKYLDKDFFQSYDKGELLLPGKSHTLKVIASIKTRASEDRIFDPELWMEGVDGLLDYIQSESLLCHKDTLNTLRQSLEKGEQVRLVALTTCSSDYTDARTIVLTAIVDK